MKHVLMIDCCVRAEQSRTLTLAKDCLKLLTEQDESHVDILRLSEEQLVPLTLETLKKREEADKADGEEVRYARQFAQADEIIIAAPYWDMSFPSCLKVYIEHACVGGITFRYENNQVVGMCCAKRLIYITTAGGFIGACDFGSSYMEGLCGMLGIGTVVTIQAEGLDMDGVDVEERLEAARREMVRALSIK